MYVIKPQPGLYVKNDSVPEDEAPQWDAEISYATGDRVIRDHYVFRALEDNQGKDPRTESDTATAPWMTLYVTNKYASITKTTSKQTVAPEGATELVIQVPFERPSIAVGLLELVATSVSVSVSAPVLDENGNPVLDDDGNPVEETVWDSGDVRLLQISNSLWGYFFTPFRYSRGWLFTGIPPTSGTLTVTVKGGRPAVGAIVPGELIDLGGTQLPLDFGIRNFSKFKYDDFGNTTLSKGRIVRRCTCKTVGIPGDIDYIHNRIVEIAGEPALFISDDRLVTPGWEGKGLEATTVLGVVTNYSPSLVATAKGELTFDIEGLI